MTPGKAGAPLGWVESQFTDLTVRESAEMTPKALKSAYKEVGRLPVVDQGQDLIAGFVDDDDLRFRGHLPVIVFGDHTRIFKYVDFPFVAGADGTRLIVPSGQALVAHESPAAAGKNWGPAGEACQVLLAPAGGRASEPATLRRDAAEDLGAAGAGRLTRGRVQRRLAKKGHQCGAVSEKCPESSGSGRFHVSVACRTHSSGGYTPSLRTGVPWSSRAVRVGAPRHNTRGGVVYAQCRAGDTSAPAALTLPERDQ